MAKGIDCTAQITDAVAKKLVKEGYTFVMRYFADPKYAYKCLTPTEAKVLDANGLLFATVYEDGAADMRYGFSRGVDDARNYLLMAKACGQPKGTAALFAADFDANGKKDFDLIEQYLKGAKTILPQFDVMPYGEKDVIDEMVRRGVCKEFNGGWQTKGWSKGLISIHALIFQHTNGQMAAGIKCDLNELRGNFKFWNSPVVQPKPVVPAPVPAVKPKPTPSPVPVDTLVDDVDYLASVGVLTGEIYWYEHAQAGTQADGTYAGILIKAAAAKIRQLKGK